jgi:STE24 endopeptidase
MDADWLYATYHYSHPILPERLRALGWYGEGGKEGKEQDAKLAKDDGGVVKAADREL